MRQKKCMLFLKGTMKKPESKTIKSICPFCGSQGTVHASHCPDSNNLREDQHGFPPYMKPPKENEPETSIDDNAGNPHYD